MIHVAYQPRTVAGERNDCGLRALCAVSGAAYEDVWKQFKSLGRRKACGTRPTWFKKALKDRHLLTWGYPTEHKPVCRSGTLSKFIRNHPKGRFIVELCDHYVAVIDGHLWDLPNADWDAMLRQRIKWAVRYA